MKAGFPRKKRRFVIISLINKGLMDDVHEYVIPSSKLEHKRVNLIILVNISPSNIFEDMLLLKSYDQSCDAIFGCCSHE